MADASQPGRVSTPLREIKHVSTATAYELWAPHYDTDGNFLQALDTLELQTLLPQFLSQVHVSRTGEAGMKVVDLGCGTGRNTLQLMSLAPQYDISEIVGLDLSQAMLSIAQKRIDEVQQSLKTSTTPPSTQIGQYDMSTSKAIEDLPVIAKNPDAVISTLVLEHLQLNQYFRVCSALVPSGGHLLITNMHSEQGAVSGAGFVDPTTGNKMRAESFAHTIPDVREAANEWGFTVEGEIMEKGVDSEELVSKLGDRSRKWFNAGIKTWFAIIFVRRMV